MRSQFHFTQSHVFAQTWARKRKKIVCETHNFLISHAPFPSHLWSIWQIRMIKVKPIFHGSDKIVYIFSILRKSRAKMGVIQSLKFGFRSETYAFLFAFQPNIFFFTFDIHIIFFLRTPRLFFCIFPNSPSHRFYSVAQVKIYRPLWIQFSFLGTGKSFSVTIKYAFVIHKKSKASLQRMRLVSM